MSPSAAKPNARLRLRRALISPKRRLVLGVRKKSRNEEFRDDFLTATGQTK